MSRRPFLLLDGRDTVSMTVWRGGRITRGKLHGGGDDIGIL